MKPHALQILVSLAGGERHGNGIVRDVLAQTDNTLRLWPVTLHRTLDELRADGLVEPLDEPHEHPEGASRRRRYYRLTDAGAARLGEEIERLDAVVRTARARVGAGPWKT